MIDAILTNTVLPTLSAEFLKRMMDGSKINGIELSVKDDQFAYAFT
jgi:type VI secretion system protein VasG